LADILKEMSKSLPFRGSNVPFSFNPGSNADLATGAIGDASSTSAAQDRLIVGVDFGTTYSGKLLAWIF
jgi:hypothetical protein